jgi:glyoxylase-like metal-dependent hydrolase (beta-lactamase superfamily II)
MLEIVSMILGPVGTNAYLVADTEAKEAAVIDPAWDGQMILREARRMGWRVGQIWVTHAHFDHFGGAAAVVDGCQPRPSLALHPFDLPMWQAQGGAPLFGMRIDLPPEPDLALQDGQRLRLGGCAFEVRHAPGHSPGHVMFYCAEEKVMFCGDVIFWGSIGRTDLPGGDYDTLIESIRSQVLSLPDETRLLTGHGEVTTVGQ